MLNDLPRLCLSDVQRRKVVLQMLPNFGPYKEEKTGLLAVKQEAMDLLDDQFKPKNLRPATLPQMSIPRVKVTIWGPTVMPQRVSSHRLFFVQNNGISFQDVIGRSLSMIGAYNDLDNQQQVVALIDDASANHFHVKYESFNQDHRQGILFIVRRTCA